MSHHHHTYAPSEQGTVVLDIGADVGALIIHTPAAMHGHEIDISPVREPQRRTHAAVRARYAGGGVSWSQLIGGLPQGRYVIWRDARTPLDEIEVVGGAVVEYHWPDSAGAMSASAD